MALIIQNSKFIRAKETVVIYVTRLLLLFITVATHET